MLDTEYKGKLCYASNSCGEDHKSGLYNESPMGIGQRIKNRREAIGKSQKELATHVGVSYQSVQQWELPDGHPKHTEPRGKRVEELAKALSNDRIATTAEWLIFGEEKRGKGDRQNNPPELDKLFSDIKGLAQENMRLLHVYVDLLLENQRLRITKKVQRKTSKQ